MQRTYLAIDLKSYYASAECAARHLDPLTTNLVVADSSRTEKTICLAVSPSLKAYGIPGRARLFEVVQKVKEVNANRLREAVQLRKAVYKDGKPSFSSASYDSLSLDADPSLELSYLVAPPRMAYYEKVSRQIYGIYLKYIAPEDIVVYSIDEVFIDATSYLSHYNMTAHDLASGKCFIRLASQPPPGLVRICIWRSWQWTSLLSTLRRTRMVSASPSWMKRASAISSGTTSRSQTSG